MQEVVYHTNYKLENSYWWFVARNQIVKSIIENRTDLPNGANVLDVGCGTGGFAKLISDRFNPICMDTSPIAIDYCRKRGITQLYETTLDDFPAKSVDFSAITMLDVIEHIEDDASVVAKAFEILPANGWFIATVPAYQRLWSKHDEIHLHYRRYNRTDFENLLKNAGFSIKYSSYFNTILFAPAIIKRFIDKITGAESKKTEPVEEVSPFINKLFTKLFLLEKKILKNAALPFGLSIVVVAKKER